jgi:hypothetical protein
LKYITSVLVEGVTMYIESYWNKFVIQAWQWYFPVLCNYFLYYLYAVLIYISTTNHYTTIKGSCSSTIILFVWCGDYLYNIRKSPIFWAAKQSRVTSGLNKDRKARGLNKDRKARKSCVCVYVCVCVCVVIEKNYYIFHS